MHNLHNLLLCHCIINIADIIGGLHQESEWNAALKVVLVLQDRDSSDETATKQFLIT